MPMSLRQLPIIATLVALLGVVTLITLGFWQLHRAEQKTLRQEHIQSMARQSAQTVEQVAGALSETDIRDMPFSATGMSQTSRIFLLDNRIQQGVVGYEVLVPVDTNAGNLLVNFGWIAGTGNRNNLPVVDIPEGLVSLNGVVSIPSDNAFIRETASAESGWPMVLQQVDLEIASNLLGSELLPFIMLLTDQQPQGFVRNWQPVVMPAEKHIGYAIQWFGLAIACVIVYLFALRSRLRTHEPSQENK